MRHAIPWTSCAIVLASAATVLLAGGAAALSGGPDAFGYAFRDNLSSGGPAFNFVSIALNGTAVPGFPCDDCLSGAVPIGFPFTFYDGVVIGQYENVYVSSNGFLTFTPGQSSGCCSGQLLPSATSPNNLVAGYWEDLNPTLGGSVRYRTVGTEPNRVFIVQFSSIQHFGGGNATTFQFKLFENTNNIEVHYSSAPSDGGTHSAGIENATGLGGLNYLNGNFALSSRAVRYAFLEPDTDATLGGTAGDLGWFRSAVTVTLTCTPPLGASCETTFRRIDLEDPFAYSVYGGPFVVSADGDHHVDYRSRSTYGTLENPERETFRIDKTPPTVTAAAVCSVALVNGFCPGTMTVTTGASDATSGLKSGQPSCTLDAVPLGCGVVPVSASGAHTFIVRAEDKAGNVGTASASFTVDNDAPLVTFAPTCTAPGSNGWCRGNVQMVVGASDAVAGLAVGSPTCKRDGVAVPCSGFTVSGDGVHTIEGRATDKAGNLRVATTQVRIDGTKPTANLGTSCAVPGNAGWCRSPLDLVVTTFDATSGVVFTECVVDDAPVPCDAQVGDEGAFEAVLTVRDEAGNQQVVTKTLKVDTIAPAPSLTTFCAKAGSPGWCRATSYQYEGKASDGGSGLAALACTVDGNPAACTGTVSGEGAHALGATASDVAGNKGDASKDLGIDSVAPTVAGSVKCSLPGNNGWCRGSTTFTVAAQDATSGIASLTCNVDGEDVPCAAPYLVQGEHTFRAIARDVAGNSAADEQVFRIDSIAPAVSIEVTCAVPGNAGWCRDKVVGVAGRAEDAASGVLLRSCTANAAAAPCDQVVTDEGWYAFFLHAEDVAGNSATTAAGFGLDRTAPTGFVDRPPAEFGGFNVDWAVADAVSGLASVEVQERELFGLLGDAWHTICAPAVGGSSAGGSCSAAPGMGQACYRVVVTDVAGHVFESYLHHLLDLEATPPGFHPSCGVGA